MNKTAFALLSVLLSATVANAQTPMIRGSVASLDGAVLSVKSGSGNTEILLVEKTEIVFKQPISVGDIKPGDFLGVTSQKGADGSLSALEIRRFPKPSNPGHRPFDGRNDQTMTNATVSQMVQASNGRELTLAYEGGAQKVVISDKASISMLVPGQRSQLVPGAEVAVTAAPGADGKLVAIRMQVGEAPKK
jgi:hypothetical protein